MDQMNKRKRLLASALLLLSAWTLSGCSALDQLILKRSGILDTAEYAHYLELKNSGQLSRQGHYVTDGLRDGIHVTFADNALLRIAYFKDKDLKESLSREACYLQPGEAIYAQISSLQDGYDCSGFQIYAFDKNGNYSNVSNLEQNLADGLVLSIPQDYAGTELSVMPVGQYRNRTITFSDCFAVEGAEGRVVGGQWLINGVPCEDNMAQISVASSAEIQYSFEPTSYYLKQASPQHPDYDEEKGILSFDPIEPGTGDLAYSVTLGKLSEVDLTVNLEKSVGDSVFSVFTSNGDNSPKGYGKSKNIYNGTIKSITPVSIKIDKSDLAPDKAFCFTVKREHDDKDTQTEILYVDQTSEDINEPDIYIPVYNRDNLLKQCTAMSISISQVDASPFHMPTLADASLSVYQAGTEDPLEDGELIEGSSKVRIKLVPNDGLYLSGKSVKNNTFEDTMSFSDYKKKIDEILDEHPRLSYIHLTLENDGKYGTCTFLLDGKEIEGTEIDAREGQTLKLKYQLSDAERYEIVRDTQGIGLITSTLANLIDESSAEYELSIKRDMDQTIISPSGYFTVERKEDK